MNKIILVDGNNILFRAFYGTSYSGAIMRNSKGFPTNALYAFINTMHKIIEDENPNYILVAFDKGKTFRHDKYEDYKAGRAKIPEDLSIQFPKAKEILKILGIKYFEIDNFEADDIIGTLSKKVEESNNFTGTIISSDKDLYQLISDKVVVKSPSKEGYKIIDKQEFYNIYKCLPINMIDLKALMGDASDNIKGVSHIGEKSAIELISKYKSLDNLYNHIDEIKGKKQEYLIEGKNQAYESYDIATIYRKVPLDFDIEDCKYSGIDLNKFRDILKELEFHSLLKKYNLLNIDNNNSSSDQITFDFDENKDKDKNKEFNLSNLNNLNKDFSFYIEIKPGVYSKSSILGIGIYDGENNYFIKEEDINKYKNIFENNLNKYTWDLKKNIILLNKYDIKINNCLYDSQVAMYLLDYNIKEDISYSMQVFNYNIDYYEDVYGTVKRPIEVEEDILIKNCLLKAKAIYETRNNLIKEINDNNMQDLFNNIEMKLTYVLADMEEVGIRVNSKYLEDLKIEIKEKLDELEKDIYSLAGCEFSILSNVQLPKILFEKLEIPYPKRIRNNKYSVSKEVLNKLTDYEIVNKILEYKMYQKLYSTYIVGLLDEVREDGKIHTIYTQTLTRTGRLSSISPNLQNIPARKDFSRIIRKAFIPDEDSLLLSSDYSQVELRIFASVANATNMINAFKNGIDIHTQTASDIFHINKEDVTKEQRSQAKAVNFGIIYGISSFGLSEDLGIKIKDAQKFIDDYLETYPEIKKYMDDEIEKVKEKGYALTLMNRKRKIPEINSSNYLIREQGKRQALNTPIQGMSADIIKKAMVELYDELNKRKLKSKILLQIHDELILNVKKDELEEVKIIVKDIMENVYKLNVPLEVSIAVGNSWYEAK